MSMMENWAEREVRLACERERKGNKTPEGEWDYGCACYESALKAYNSLMEDGHSGMSIGFTKGILMRLLEHRTLTPIYDTPDVWDDITDISDDDCVSYQCNRMSSLFKYVYKDGRVEYADVDRVIGININNPNWTYTSGTISRIVNELYPITLPYYPSTKRYRVYTEDFLSDSANGDFDTEAILYLITPDDEKVELNRFYHEFEKGKPMKEISKEKYEEFKKKANRITKNKNN